MPHSRGFDFHTVFGNTTAPQSLLQSRSVADGGYNYSLLVPVEPGVAAVGVHVVQGRIGALFRPLMYNDPAVVSDVDAFGASWKRWKGARARANWNAVGAAA